MHCRNQTVQSGWQAYLVVMKARMSCRHWVMASTLPPLLQTISPVLHTPFCSASVGIPSCKCCSEGEALIPSPLSSDLRVECTPFVGSASPP